MQLTRELDETLEDSRVQEEDLTLAWDQREAGCVLGGDRPTKAVFGWAEHDTAGRCGTGGRAERRACASTPRSAWSMVFGVARL